MITTPYHESWVGFKEIRVLSYTKEFLTTNIDITTWRPVLSVEDWTAYQY